MDQGTRRSFCRSREGLAALDFARKQVVRDHYAVDLFGRVGIPEVDDRNVKAPLRKDVPDGVGLTVAAEQQARLSIGPGLREIGDAVLPGPLPGGNRVPDSGRDHRHRRAQRPHHPFARESLEVRQATGFQHRFDHAQRGAIESNDQHATGRLGVAPRTAHCGREYPHRNEPPRPRKNEAHATTPLRLRASHRKWHAGAQ